MQWVPSAYYQNIMIPSVRALQVMSHLQANTLQNETHD